MARIGCMWSGEQLLSIYHIVRVCEDGSYIFLFKVFVAFGLRVHYGFNKYILWSAFSLLSMPTVEGLLSEAVGTAAISAANLLPLLTELAGKESSSVVDLPASLGDYGIKLSTAIIASYCMLAIKKPRGPAEPTASKAAEVALDSGTGTKAAVTATDQKKVV